MSNESDVKLAKLKKALEDDLLTKEEYEQKVKDLFETGETEITEEDNDDGVIYFNEAGQATDHQLEPEPKKNKKKIVIIGAMVVLAVIIIAVIAGRGDSGDKSTKETYDWPSENLIAAMLPEPEGKLTYISIDAEEGKEYLNAEVNIDKQSECQKYAEACKEKGFTNVSEMHQSGDSYNYTAMNEEGWEVDVYSYDKQMNITLKSPGFIKEQESDYEEIEDEDTSEEDEDTTEETKDVPESSRETGSVNLKEVMDGYEKFMDEYIAFMKKYKDSDDTVSMLNDYSKMMDSYTEWVEKIDDIDYGSLSASDRSYYMEVVERVNKKLLDANI